jgi:hypothetical protein
MAEEDHQIVNQKYQDENTNRLLGLCYIRIIE